MVPAARSQALVWERVGDQPIGATRPSFGPDGTMWTSGADGTTSLSPPYGPSSPWTIFPSNYYDKPILALGQDTLVTSLFRSVDGGQTFEVSTFDWGESSGFSINETIVEVPLGLPHGGALVLGGDGRWAAYSHDRGASWSLTSIPNAASQYPSAEAFAVVRQGPRAGRIVGVGLWGLATSDDGGVSFVPVTGRWAHFRYYAVVVGVLGGAAPGGGDRLVATMVDPEHVPYTECIVVVSDDGGDTWRETADLTGDPNSRGAAVVDFGRGRAVIVMNGGHVWESRDAGETWARLAAVVPGALVDPAGSPRSGRAMWALRGPDGRLYVGGSRLGGVAPGWTYRTALPAVAGEASPVEAAGVAVSVRPNPAGGRVEVVVSLAAAQEVRVVVLDALGREVAVVLDGEAVGERVVAVDTGSWPAGVYVVRASIGTRVASARLVVAR